MKNHIQESYSPWSLPSDVLNTIPSVLKAPTDLTLVDKNSSSVIIGWHGISSQQQKEGRFAEALFYTVQYRLQGFLLGSKSKQNSISWIDHTEIVTAIQSHPTPEVQEITVLSEEYGLIAGSFWLQLSIPNNDPTRHYTNLKSNAISDSIPYNATREQLQSALVKIEGIKNLRVFHQERGKYRVEYFVQDSHASPLIQLYRYTLEQGQGSKEELKGKERDAIVIKRISSARPTILKDRLFATISFLESQQKYEFRVCAENKDTRGEWSNILSNVTTDQERTNSTSIKLCTCETNPRKW